MAEQILDQIRDVVDGEIVWIPTLTLDSTTRQVNPEGTVGFRWSEARRDDCNAFPRSHRGMGDLDLGLWADKLTSVSSSYHSTSVMPSKISCWRYTLDWRGLF